MANHLFRHEAGKMVAVLTHIFGTENLQTAEDVVQDTLLHAMQVWAIKEIPPNPTAWLYHVAKNKTIDILRKNKHATNIDISKIDHLLNNTAEAEFTWQDELIKDDMLRMMFACCHPDISEENQITLILKTLCGFSTAEIAKAFLTAEDTISKRLYRTKEFFREQKIKLLIPSIDELKKRTNAVLNSIYLLFNEGYNSTNSEALIRKDLMNEAMLLCKLLTENSNTQLPETYALMALMCFHSSRTDSRLTTNGEIILLQNQDRSKWNHQFITKGNDYMNKAAFGNNISTYHLEAAIAFEHCTAKNFETTNWKQILKYYDWLGTLTTSSFTQLNRAVAVLHVEGATAALQAIENISDVKKIQTSYLYHAVLGEIYARLHKITAAKQSFEKAIALTQSVTEKKILKEKIAALLN